MNNQQLAKIHILAAKAWRRIAYLEELPIGDNKAADTWRREQMRLVCGKSSSKALTEGQYEEVMLHFAECADDDREIGYWSGAKERRYTWQVHRFLRLLSFVRGETVGWSYVQSVLERMRLPDRLADLPAERMQDVIAALDTHVRRLCERYQVEPKDVRKAYEGGDPQSREMMKAFLDGRRDRLGIRASEGDIMIELSIVV